MDRPTCDSCQFFHAHKSVGGKSGECRANPPQVSANGPMGEFPGVEAQTWCGRHKSLPAHKMIQPRKVS